MRPAGRAVVLPAVDGDALSLGHRTDDLPPLGEGAGVGERREQRVVVSPAEDADHELVTVQFSALPPAALALIEQKLRESGDVVTVETKGG